MSFKRIAFAGVVACCAVSSLFAYDTQGKFGMGIRMMGTPVILFSSMKYGITNTVGIEPSIGFDRIRLTVEEENMYGPDSVVKEERSLSLNLFNVSGMLDIKPIRAEKSNFVIRLGLDYIRGSASGKQDNPDTTYDDNLWRLGFAGGLGIEHFFTDHFSAYAGFLNSFNIMGASDPSLKSFSFANFGNQFAELTFIWYLR